MHNPRYRGKPGLRGGIFRCLLIAVSVTTVVAACSPAAPSPTPGPTTTDLRPAGSTPSSPVSSTAVIPETTTAPPTSAAEPFDSTISIIDDETAARMSLSWRPGCPVPLENLRLLRLPYVTFGGTHAIGELVVHQDYAEDIVSVFESLFRNSFPIERMQLVDLYGADDRRSMAANNTSGFNCREVAGAPGVWSEHAFGRAIDINPVQNPYVRRDGSASPEAGMAYLQRDATVPGLITTGDVVVEAFSAVDWVWGGTWSNSKDYQHFSATGR